MGSYEAIFNLIGSILGGVVIGAFCGVISLIVGIIKKKKSLGLIGFFVSIAFGIFMTQKSVYKLPSIVGYVFTELRMWEIQQKRTVLGG